MKFFNPNERIKDLRIRLNMVQHDFEDDNLTRSYFGMIESGKRNLNLKSAEIIANKLNSKALEIGSNLNITANYLMLTKEEEAFNYCINQLELKDINEDKINEIIDIAKEYKLHDILGKAYKILGNHHFENHKYQESFRNYLNALDVYSNIGNKDEQPFIFNRLGICKHESLHHSEALIYFKKAYYKAKSINNKDILYKSLFNVANCYVFLKNSDEALYYIEKYIEGYENSDEAYVYAKCIRANCYKDKGDITKSIEYYEILINEIKESYLNIQGLIYTNLGELYLAKEDITNSLKCFNKSEEIRMKVDPEALSHTLIEKSKVYIKQEMYTEAAMIINLGIDMALKYNDNKYLLQGYYLFEEIYKTKEDYSNLEDIYLKIVELSKKLNNDKELLKVYLRLIALYNINNDFDKMENIIKLSHNIVEKCC